LLPCRQQDGIIAHRFWLGKLKIASIRLIIAQTIAVLHNSYTTSATAAGWAWRADDVAARRGEHPAATNLRLL